MRAARILSSIGTVVAEDTRITRRLLTRLDAHALQPTLKMVLPKDAEDLSPRSSEKSGGRSNQRLIPWHKHSRTHRMDEVLKALEAGDVALVTDAGTPGIRDPGAEIVRAAADKGHTICPLSGPSAVTAAISVSGFSADSFTFLGFLPRKHTLRRVALEEGVAEGRLIVFFESPHRIRATLEDLAQIAPDLGLCVCRELTKMHEEVFYGNAVAALDRFSEPKGEFTVVMEGKKAEDAEVSDESIVSALRAVASEGFTGRQLTAESARRTGASRSRVYRLRLTMGTR